MRPAWSKRMPLPMLCFGGWPFAGGTTGSIGELFGAAGIHLDAANGAGFANIDDVEVAFRVDRGAFDLSVYSSVGVNRLLITPCCAAAVIAPAVSAAKTEKIHGGLTWDMALSLAGSVRHPMKSSNGLPG